MWGGESTNSSRVADRILVVEDDPRLVEVLAHQLRRDGYDVRTVSTGYDAGYEIQRFHPHLVFLDLMLPGVNGAEVCSRVRADEHLRGIRIIGMSATSDMNLVARFRQAGIDDFMPKPFKLTELKERIETLIGPIRPDPEGFERNRVLLYSGDADWTARIARSLQLAAYAVESAATPEAAGFAAARFKPDIVVTRPPESEGAAGLRKNGTPMLATDRTDDLIASIVSAIGPKTARAEPRAASRIVVPIVAAAATVLALFAGALIIWPDGRRAAETPPGQAMFEGVMRNSEEIQWIEEERRARDQHLVFFAGGWYNRKLLGEGARVTLKSRTLEGLLAESKEGGWALRTPDHTYLRLSAADIVSKEPLRVPYEEYWDWEQRLDEKDADGHHLLGLWARDHKLQEVAAREFRRAIIAHTDHEGARHELGYEKQGARWARVR